MNPLIPPLTQPKNDYPTGDGRPMAETDLHRDIMVALISTLQEYYQSQPLVYVSGDLLVFYERGNKRRHVAPDVFVVKGVPKYRRENYLLWEEKPIDFVIEVTSSSSRHTDVHRKFELYRDILKVKEYFLFDPREDYLDPSLRGYRLRGGVYRPIRSVEGRFPSQVLGLHLERAGQNLRLYDPVSKVWLLTHREQAREERQARVRLEEENQRLRQQLDDLLRGSEN